MNKNQRLIVVLLFLIVLCGICCGIYLIIDLNDNPQPTPPVSSIDPLTIIANTSSAAQTQTAVLISVISTESISEFPTSISQPTLAPTQTPAPTETLYVLTLVTVPSNNQNNQTSQCSCTADTYNCGDLLAESCFSYCNAQGYGDIHRLDQDGDGVACEDN